MANSFEDKLINFLNKLNAMNKKENRNLLLKNMPPSPTSTIDRYDSRLADLSTIVKNAKDWGKLLSGDYALQILMNNAKQFVKGTELEEQLKQLILEFDSQLQNEIEIPFVIVAMTKSEVEGLTKKITSNQGQTLELELEKFQKIINLIQKDGRNFFVAHYSNLREEWKPFTLEQESIKTVITNIISDINSFYESSNIPWIKPIFVSEDFLGDDYNRRIDIWNNLRQSGCVIIVDAISLFHPQVRETLLQAQITSKENVTILVLSPVNPYEIEANKLLEEIIRHRMQAAFSRFDKNFDKFCEIGIGNLRTIKRWFFSIIPETIENITNQKPLLQNRQVFSRTMDSEGKSGYEELIFGKTGKRSI